MVYGLVLVIHILLALFLIAIILLQGGRGGLGEALGGAAAQSLFGGSANTVMTKLTAFCAGLFMVTSLGLAMLSTARGRSVIDQLPAAADQLPFALPASEPAAPEPQSVEPSVSDAEPPSTAAPAEPTP